MSRSKLLICLSLSVLLLQNLLLSCSSSDQRNKYINPTEHPDLVDQGWLERSVDCSAPCWRGLEPGVSSQAEATALVQTLSFVGAGKELNNTLDDMVYSCKTPSSEICLAMQFEDGTLSNLWFYPNYQITLEDVVVKMGIPDSFYYSRRDPEKKGCSLRLLWINRQMEIGYADRPSSFGDDLCDFIGKENGKLPKGLFVNQVHIMTSGRIKEIVETVQQPGTGQNYTSWSGFVK